MPEFDSRNIVHFALVIQEAMRDYVRLHRDGTYRQEDVEKAGVAAGMQFSRGAADPAMVLALARREQSVYPPGFMLRCV